MLVKNINTINSNYLGIILFLYTSVFYSSSHRLCVRVCVDVYIILKLSSMDDIFHFF